MQHKNLRSIPTVELRNELAARTIERDAADRLEHALPVKVV